MEEKAAAVPLALLLLLLLVPAPAGAWDQAGGSPTHSATLPLAPGPLDILGHGDFGGLGVTSYFGAGILSTPDGIVASLGDFGDDDCALVVLDEPLGPPRARYAYDACGYPALLAYDAPTHAAIVCRITDLAKPVVEARDVRDGSQLWALRGSQLATLPSSGGASCWHGALDVEARELIVPVLISARGAVTNTLVSVDVDSGAIRWRSQIPTAPSTERTPVAPIGPATFVGEEYRGVTLTSTGIVLTGYAFCPANTVQSVGVGFSCNEGVLAWFDRDGTFVGKLRTVTGQPESLSDDSFENDRGVSKFAAAEGATAAYLFGNEVILVNPQIDAPVSRAAVESLSPYEFPFVTQSVWSQGTIVVSFVSSLAAVDPTLGKRWAWTEGAETYITDLTVTSGGQLLVTVESFAEASVDITVLDLASGKPALTLPMPFTISDDDRFDYNSKLAPMPGGRALLVDPGGHRVLLGVADPAELPRVEPSNAYPTPGAEVTFDIRAPPGADVDHFVAFWGDGATEKIPPGAQASHVFATRGEHDVRVLAMLKDGRTRTAVVTVHVGGVAPAELTLLQKAFSPENQEITFFALGTLITVLGVAYTIGRHRRRFARLERELAAVEEIRMLSTSDPRGAILALKTYRDRLPEDLARRRIDDSQYQILDIRSARLLKVLRTRMFAPYDTRLSMRYHRLLDAAFEDAILQPSERDALVGALAAEDALRPGERESIEEILGEFTSTRGRGA